MSIIQDDIRFGARLAGRLRTERERHGWSIADLAERSGVSRAMISKIERGQASPTAALLLRLSGAFGLSLSRLLAATEDATDDRMMRAADRPVWRDPGSGYLRRPLTPPGATPELIHVELPPGAVVPAPRSGYSFMRGQCIWLLEGALRFTEGEAVHLLAPGDCLALGPPDDCEFANPSSAQPCRYVVAIAWR